MQGTKTDAGVLFEVEGEEPINASLDDNDNPRYQTDSFRMLFMKVLPCCKRFVHDWSDCPFSHPGEKARRRDPKVHQYTGIACPDMKKTGSCPRGDKCPYAHNVFEYWLHPTRYRSQLCNDGPKCRRRVCFFAHTIDQLRVPSSKPLGADEAPELPLLPPGQMEVGPIPVPAAAAPADAPYIHSPSAAHEPPAGSPRPHPAAGSAQTVSFAPPEGFMDVDRSDKLVAAAGGTASSSGDANSGAAMQVVTASLANVKSVIRSGTADRYQVIDMLTSLLRETLQDTPGASAREAMRLAASGPAEPTSAADVPPASDPFTAAARSSFDAPWPNEEASEVAGQAPSAAAISAALSGAPSSAAPAAADAAAAAADPDATDERVAPMRRAGLPAGPLPADEGLLGRPAGPPRQSSAPDTLLTARSTTSSAFASSRPTTTDGTNALLPQPSRGLEMSGRRAAAVSSTHMQAQQKQQQHAAAQQQQQAAQLQQQHQQLIQQLQQRRAALLAQGAYKRGGGSSLPSNVTMGRAQPPNMQGALEEYSRSGDVRVLQQFSALMGSPAVARSLSADYSMQGMYSVPLDASGYDLGGMNARDLHYSDAFAPSQFGDVSGAGYISGVEYNAPRMGSAPAYLDSSEAASDPYGSAYQQMFGSAYSGVFPGGSGAADAAGSPQLPRNRQSFDAYEAGYLAATGALGAAPEGTPPTSNASDWAKQQ
ncbi:g5102 [Coccomyxa elongata]